MLKKYFFTILFAVILFFSTSIPKPTNAAVWSMLPTQLLDYAMKIPGVIAQVGSYFGHMAEMSFTAGTAQSLLLNKVLALLAVQEATSLLVGDGPDGTIIRDFNNYLYVSPQQRAMAQMNSFFNTVSQGRLSSLNYEGIGPNYDAYLVNQAKQAIAGQAFATNLQNIVTNPSQLLDGGNMKGLMTYMQCANNVACYTLTSTEQYNLEFEKAQTIAKNENVNGFVPKKLNGRIVQPASLAQNALTQIDQLGTQLIITANPSDNGFANLTAIEQVWTGAGISATARLTNYGISDSAGKAAIMNKNDQFPFSLSYTTDKKGNGSLDVKNTK
ncbi:MAG: hypothetical protein PHW24_03310 [Candidatus Moranbacteria bacterium]|nr:hypothetical protein [Candidatus Moranbacteria bacterium]